MAGLSFAFDTSKGETPATIAQKRALVAQLMGSHAAPTTLGAGFSALGDGIVANVTGRRADEAQQQGQSQVDAFRQMLTGSYGAPGATPTPATTGAPASVPQGGDAASIRQGLIDRGLPEHVADGFLMNFQDESGLNSGINEQNPTVAGSRGGYGLYQLTGPRRVAYEQYAQQRGVDPSDTNAQLDFMMSELQGPEAKAAQSIMAAPDAGSAAAAIARDFLRPAPENLAPRVAKYTAGGQQQPPVQVASLDPSVGAPQSLQPVGPGELPDSAQPGQFATGPDGNLQAYGNDHKWSPIQVDGAPTQALTAPQSPNQTQPDQGLSMQQLMQAAGNPFVMAQYGDVINSMISQQMQTQQQANDPLRQLQIQAAQQGLNAPIEVGGVLLDRDTMQPVFDSRTTKGAGLINAGDGKIYNPATQEWITAPGSAEGNVPDSVKALDMRAQRAGLQPGTPEYNEFMVSGGRAGTSLSVAPDGTVNFSQGGAGKPLTEGQSKDTVYATRAEGALPIIDALGGELTDLRTSVTGQAPVLGNYTKSPEYQQAEQAGTEFLQAILRKDTGAAITPQETAEYGKVYLPRPGDSQQLLEQKRVSRQRALEAIKAGLPPQAILQSEQALINSSGPGMSAPQQSRPPQVNTETEYNALPSGSVYLDPTGQIRTKR